MVIEKKKEYVYEVILFCIEIRAKYEGATVFAITLCFFLQSSLSLINP